MKIVILPGYSVHNKDWAYEVKKNLKINGEVIVHEWKHWTTGGSMNIKTEVEKLLSIIGNEQVKIIAKSVGTRVSMILAGNISDRVEKVILCGIPMDPFGYTGGLKKIGSDKLLVIQNSQDPFMPYSKIKLYLKLIDKNIKVVKKEASNHDYPYFDDFNEFLS